MENNNEITEFRVIPNGPLHVKGNFVIKSANGKELEVKEEAWLCRCGGSKSKPFCDGTHKTLGVRD